MQFFNVDNKKLVGNNKKKYNLVCDVFPSWCGPCEMLFPSYKNLALTIDDFDKRVDIILVIYLKIIFKKLD